MRITKAYVDARIAYLNNMFSFNRLIWYSSGGWYRLVELDANGNDTKEPLASGTKQDIYNALCAMIHMAELMQQESSSC